MDGPELYRSELTKKTQARELCCREADNTTPVEQARRLTVTALCLLCFYFTGRGQSSHRHIMIGK